MTQIDVEIVLVPFELRPSMPTAGALASELGIRHSERVEEYMLRAAREEGLAMRLQDRIPNTHMAMLVGEVGRDEGAEAHASVHKAIFSAYFAEGRDIGDKGVLLDVARQVGLDPSRVRSAWQAGEHEARLLAFRKVAQSLGIDAVPAALICNELLVGSRPYKVVRDAVDRCLLTPEKAEREASGGADRSEG